MRRPSVLGFAIAAFLLEGWVVSDRALATCGDYVMVGGRGHHETGHGMPGVPGCHGPNCHNRSPLPALPTKGLPVTSPVESAYCAGTDRSSEPSLSGQIFEPAFLLSEGHSLPLLRPPCL